GAPDPTGKLLYSMTTQITKLVDRYEIAKPKYTIIDLDQQKITKTVDEPTNENGGEGGPGGGFGGGGGGGGRFGGSFEVSPDGKYLYQFGSSITVLKSEDFSFVEKIELAQPDAPAMENLGLGGMIDAISE